MCLATNEYVMNSLIRLPLRLISPCAERYWIPYMYRIVGCAWISWAEYINNEEHFTYTDVVYSSSNNANKYVSTHCLTRCSFSGATHSMQHNGESIESILIKCNPLIVTQMQQMHSVHFKNPSQDHGDCKPTGMYMSLNHIHVINPIIKV